jgi:DNA-binding GntR family transcriptional regulator
MTERDLDEIFQLRYFVEIPAMVALSERMDLLTAERIERFRGILDELEAHAEAGDLAEMIDGDRQFHSELLGLLENRRLVELVERLRGYTRRKGMPALDRDQLIAIAADHRRILDALVDGDTDNVRRIMEEHLAANRGILAGPAGGSGATPDGDEPAA